MPENLRCTECELVVYGITEPEPSPIDRDECPRCGNTEFEVL